jgi:hypothetical protein
MFVPKGLTFAYLGDMDVEPADEEVCMLDLLRHGCLRCCSSRPARPPEIEMFPFSLQGSEVDRGLVEYPRQ